MSGLRIPNAGTYSVPWICFSRDSETGVSVIDGEVVYILKGKEVSGYYDWLTGIHREGHIDNATKWALIASLSTGSTAIGALSKFFSSRASKARP